MVHRELQAEAMETENDLDHIERRKLEFRTKIKNAAIKLFAESGPTKTSVASIIKEAGIAHKTFFNHFPTKDHLLQDIVTELTDRAYAIFKTAEERDYSPQKRVAYSLTEICKELELLSTHEKELVNFCLVSTKGSRELQEEQEDKFYRAIQDILKQAKKKKILRPGFTIETLSEIIVGIYASIVMRWTTHDDYPLTARMKKAAKFINSTVFIEE